MRCHWVLSTAFAAAFFALIPTAGAQAPRVAAVPSIATGYYDGVASCTISIFGGRTRMAFQVWYRGDTLPTRPAIMVAIGDRPQQGLSIGAEPADLEVILSSTTATPATLDRTFANNLGNDAVTFFSRKVINLPPLSNHTDPNTPFTWILGDRPFLFIQGPHFLVYTMTRTEATARSTGHRTHAAPVIQGGHATSDASCGGNLNASYTNGIFNLDLDRALPNAPALFMIALRNFKLGGSILLPMDLGPLGLTSCRLAVDPLFYVPMVTNAAGNARLTVPFATPPESLFVHSQVIHGSTANPAGLALSNVAHSVIRGNLELMAYVYDFNDVTPTAPSGVFRNTRCPVLLYR